ncbi:hypothetical protein OIV83_002056 [Microbotryomycetes sp. JL201]|nr:hypothetical protein OIV83_002056 [Microbotryomycetes sp. JL201]
MKFSTVIVALASTSLVAASSSYKHQAEQARDAVYNAADEAQQITFDKWQDAKESTPDWSDKWQEIKESASEWTDDMRKSANKWSDDVMDKVPSFDDACPDLVVRCIKDGDVTKPVGDIGKKSFCAKEKGIGCKQCHSKINTAECNAKYLKDCAGKCKAVGSPL